MAARYFNNVINRLLSLSLSKSAADVDKHHGFKHEFVLESNTVTRVTSTRYYCAMSTYILILISYNMFNIWLFVDHFFKKLNLSRNPDANFR